MKIFTCQRCGQQLYFENTVCLGCGATLGYIPGHETLSAVTADGPLWIAAAEPDPALRYRFCENWEQSACNWMLRVDPAEFDTPEAETRCRACRHNRTIPDLSDPGAHARWQKIEAAKRRLVYGLERLGLPRPVPGGAHPQPLVFDFLDPGAAGGQVMTGHDTGLITLSLDEADDALREKARTELGEPYRTLLGHFRHEVGHYYWDLLLRDAPERLAAFRALFGDERADYQAALDRHYHDGPPPGWETTHVSAYATMHPWEDWAETWAHYMHMVDTLEVAGAFGIRIAPEAGGAGPVAAGQQTAQAEGHHIAAPPVPSPAGVEAGIREGGDGAAGPDGFGPDGSGPGGAGGLAAGQGGADPYETRQLAPLIAAWTPLTLAVNALNRAMGMPDIYPFALPGRAIEKLGFVHDLVRAARASDGAAPPAA